MFNLSEYDELENDELLSLMLYPMESYNSKTVARLLATINGMSKKIVNLMLHKEKSEEENLKLKRDLSILLKRPIDGVRIEIKDDRNNHIQYMISNYEADAMNEGAAKYMLYELFSKFLKDRKL